MEYLIYGFNKLKLQEEGKMNAKDLITTLANAINNKQMVMVRFKTRDNQILLRKCAPLDYSLSKRAKTPKFKVHFWDFGSSKQNHVLSLDYEEIIELSVINESFKPKDFITWDTKASPWLIIRDWGIYS